MRSPEYIYVSFEKISFHYKVQRLLEILILKISQKLNIVCKQALGEKRTNFAFRKTINVNRNEYSIHFVYIFQLKLRWRLCVAFEAISIFDRKRRKKINSKIVFVSIGKMRFKIPRSYGNESFRSVLFLSSGHKVHTHFELILIQSKKSSYMVCCSLGIQIENIGRF